MEKRQSILRQLTPLQKFELKVEKSNRCWLWVGSKNPDGYGNFRLFGRNEKAHRAAWIFYRGEIGDKSVLHRCDTPSCVNPDHLFLGTQKDNVNDMARKGRHVGFRRLTKEQVEEIRSHEGYYGINVALAKKYGVSDECIRSIRKGLRWTDAV